MARADTSKHASNTLSRQGSRLIAIPTANTVPRRSGGRFPGSVFVARDTPIMGAHLDRYRVARRGPRVPEIGTGASNSMGRPRHACLLARASGAHASSSFSETQTAGRPVGSLFGRVPVHPPAARRGGRQHRTIVRPRRRLSRLRLVLARGDGGPAHLR